MVDHGTKLKYYHCYFGSQCFKGFGQKAREKNKSIKA